MEKRNIDMMPAFIFVWHQTVTGCRLFIKVLKYRICTHRNLSALHLCVLWKGKDLTPQRTWHNSCCSPTHCHFSHASYALHHPASTFSPGSWTVVLTEASAWAPAAPDTGGQAATLGKGTGPVYTQVSTSGPAVPRSAIWLVLQPQQRLCTSRRRKCRD